MNSKDYKTLEESYSKVDSKGPLLIHEMYTVGRSPDASIGQDETTSMLTDDDESDEITYLGADDCPHQTEHGELVINGQHWAIIDWHSFDDFGQTFETVTIKKDGEEKEAYSQDEGNTWTLDLLEPDLGNPRGWGEGPSSVSLDDSAMKSYTPGYAGDPVIPKAGEPIEEEDDDKDEKKDEKKDVEDIEVDPHEGDRGEAKREGKPWSHQDKGYKTSSPLEDSMDEFRSRRKVGLNADRKEKPYSPLDDAGGFGPNSPNHPKPGTPEHREYETRGDGPSGKREYDNKLDRQLKRDEEAERQRRGF
jgi:hypothetical protein